MLLFFLKKSSTNICCIYIAYVSLCHRKREQQRQSPDSQSLIRFPKLIEEMKIQGSSRKAATNPEIVKQIRQSTLQIEIGGKSKSKM